MAQSLLLSLQHCVQSQLSVSGARWSARQGGPGARWAAYLHGVALRRPGPLSRPSVSPAATTAQRLRHPVGGSRGSGALQGALGRGRQRGTHQAVRHGNNPFLPGPRAGAPRRTPPPSRGVLGVISRVAVHNSGGAALRGDAARKRGDYGTAALGVRPARQHDGTSTARTRHTPRTATTSSSLSDPWRTEGGFT